ncbi:MarR family winged helix-turn-helix transcriptional regulator [Granulicatella sp. WM01]|uniref:MarR family winged helix-turn-helix transcriptional regulator n=1 Tax=unclassified Granulicatella TaxID=2630493 RepID=UPI001FD83EE0|nr:MarR family transcriptional regulator [Granulicatella sp. WM01]
MTESYDVINEYLVNVFNKIMDIEETALKISRFSDLSIKEMHTIEAIGIANPLSSTEIAKKLNITVGTLTVAVNNLVRKGYVERLRLDDDRRVVRLKLTKEGKLLYRIHAKFHRLMVIETLKGMDEAEVRILVKGLKNLHTFLFEKQEEQRKLLEE